MKLCEVTLLSVPLLSDYWKVQPTFQAKCWRRVTDLTMDLQDGVIYTYLLNQIAPRGSNICNSPLLEKNKEKRAIAFLKEADKIGCRFHLTPEDLLGNSFTVHLVYVFRLFLKYPGLPMTAPLAESENFDL
uniref:Calponin-homology (CH) domain-containing protein n=1 Tax=Panagrolaimus sp. JU765 TaxID=591449 RepID=A0AC34R0D0_9BILA